jgi:ABC-type lipoprotein export system ATPase subunit
MGGNQLPPIYLLIVFYPYFYDMEKQLLQRKTTPLICSVISDSFIKASEKAFDCTFNGTSEFYPWEKPQSIPDEFNIGVIVGKSGSGKSTLLSEFGEELTPSWDTTKSIISHFDTPDEAINRLSAVGLNSVPSWYKPYDVLSNGEKFRADLARKILSNSVIDEYSSVVDRNVAKASSVALSRYVIKNNIKNVVLATCHEDVIDWLQPDWVINTDTGELYDGFFLSDQKSISKYTQQIAISGPCLKTIII